MQNNRFCERAHYWNPDAFNNINDVEFFAIPRCCGVENNYIKSNYIISGGGRGNQKRALFKFTISGSGLLNLDGHRHILNSGKAILLVGPGNYTYQINPDDENWQFIFLSFRNELAVEIIEKIIAKNGNVFELDNNGKVMNEVWKLYEYFKQGNFNDKYKMSILGYSFMMQLDKIFDEKLPQNNTSTLIAQLTNYCFKNISKPISVSELATISGYTRGHLTRLLNRETGKNPSKFILDIKLDYALEILQSEKISIKRLAQLCGFNDQGYFRRVFAKRYKVPPSRYQEL